jgi:large repetitive protein
MTRAAWAFFLCSALLSSALSAQTETVASTPKRTVFSATGLPPGTSIHPQTGVISGVVDRAAIYDGNMTYDIVINVDNVNGGTGSGKLTFVVPNSPPVATDDTFTVEVGAVVNIPVLANDFDPDGDSIVIISVQAETANVTGFGPSGIKYRAGTEPDATEVLHYDICDGHGGRASGLINVMVNKAH